MSTASVVAAQAPIAPAELAHAQIRETAQKFEASFLSVMLQQAFQGVGDDDGPFGGGPGEAMFKSFLTEEMAKQTARSGGVGVAAQVEREMLKLQGLT
jgi:Rod binding domain-containing protein